MGSLVGILSAIGSAQIQVSTTAPIQLNYTGTGESYATAPFGIVVSSSVPNWRVYATVDPVPSALGTIAPEKFKGVPVTSTPPPGGLFVPAAGAIIDKFIAYGPQPTSPITVGSMTVTLSSINPLTPVGASAGTIRFFGKAGTNPPVQIAAMPLIINVRPYLKVSFATPTLSMMAGNPGVWSMLGKLDFEVTSNSPSADVQLAIGTLKEPGNPASNIPPRLVSINWGTSVADVKAKLAGMPLGINTASLTVGYGVTKRVMGTKVQILLKQKPATYEGQLTLTASGA